MNNDQKNPIETKQDASENLSPNQARRHFAKSVAGSGVILSLASKPVMGSNYWCTASGGLSGNTSSHGQRQACLACSPGFWKGSPENWPSPYYPYNICNSTGKVNKYATKFNAVFTSSDQRTMKAVLDNSPGSREFHAIAALLNAARSAQLGLASAFTVAEVKTLYNQGAPASTFSSTYEGTMHNCTISNNNSSIYLATNQPFCNLILSNGDDSGKPNPICCK